MQIGILIALASALLMTGMQILLKKSYKELDPSLAFFFDSIFGLLIWIPVGCVFGATFDGVIKCFGYAIISAILSEALVFYALSKGNLSISSVLISTYPVFTLIFSLLINNEILTVSQVVLIVFTIIGIVLTCIDKEFKIKNIKNKEILIPIITALAIGLSDTLTKGIINITSSFSFIVAIALVQVPVALIYLKMSKQKISNIKSEYKKDSKFVKYSVLGSLLNIMATGCLLISFNYTYASIASPLTAIYTPIVLLYSLIFLREKIGKVNLIGTIIALIGTFGIIILG